MPYTETKYDSGTWVSSDVAAVTLFASPLNVTAHSLQSKRAGLVDTSLLLTVQTRTPIYPGGLLQITLPEDFQARAAVSHAAPRLDDGSAPPARVATLGGPGRTSIAGSAAQAAELPQQAVRLRAPSQMTTPVPLPFHYRSIAVPWPFHYPHS